MEEGREDGPEEDHEVGVETVDDDLLDEGNDSEAVRRLHHNAKTGVF